MKIESLTLHTESRCNLDCTYCYTKNRRNSKIALTLKDFKKNILEAKSLGAKTVHLIGPGEPLLMKNLKELINFNSKNNLKTHIFTNGILLDDNFIDFFLKHSVDLTIKMHALNKKTYDELAGIKTKFKWIYYSFKYKNENLRIEIPIFLKKLLDKKYHKRLYKINFKNMFDKPFDIKKYFIKPNMRLESVITSKNLEEILKTSEFCKKLKIPILTETLMGNENLNLKPKKEEYKKLYYDLIEILGNKFIEEQKRTNCHFNSNPIIYENGTVSNCTSKVTNIIITEEKTLEKAFKKVLNNFNSLKIKNRLFRNCYGRQLLENEKLINIKHK